MHRVPVRLMLVACLASAVTIPVQSQTLTLNQYIQRVVKHNKDLELAKKDRELASTQKKQAVSAAYPQVGMETGYTRNLTDYFMYIDMEALNPEAVGVAKAPVKRKNEFTASVGLQQTLFSPQIGSAIRAARQYENVATEVYDASMQAIVAGSKKLFYSVLLLQKVYEVAESTEVNAQENYEHVTLRYANGQVSRFELLQAETRWRSTVPETREAQRNLALTLNTMKHMAGIPVDEEIQLAGRLDDVPAVPEELTLEQVLAALPDYRAILWEEKLRQTSVGAAKGSYLPTLSGMVAYAYSAQSDEFEMDEENKFWFAGVKLSLPLFTGGLRPAMVQKARVELEKTRLGIAKTKESIQNEITSIELRLKEAHERIVAAEATLNAARQAFGIAEVTASNGMATQLQLKDARVGYDQATLNYYAAMHDYITAYFDWELATGRVTE